MKTKGYKVVLKTRKGKLLSALVGFEAFEKHIYPEDVALAKRLCVEYKEGLRARPRVKGTRLFAFLSLEDSLEYKNTFANRGNGTLLVYEAELRCPKKVGWLTGMVTLHELLAFFKQYEEPWNFNSTVACSSIVLLKEVS